MELIHIFTPARKSWDPTVLDFTIVADVGYGPEIMEFTWRRGEKTPFSILIEKWVDAYVGELPTIEYVPYELLTTDINLTPYQLRMALLNKGISMNMIANAILTEEKDELEQDRLKTHFEYAVEFEWDDPLTQRILSFTGISQAELKGMWLKAAQKGD